MRQSAQAAELEPKHPHSWEQAAAGLEDGPSRQRFDDGTPGGRERARAQEEEHPTRWKRA